MSASKSVFKKYVKNIFIETGSYKGDGVGDALAVGFKRAYSIELSPELHAYCVDLYENNPNAIFVQGYSPEYLKVILAHIHEPVTFWLDAHYSGGMTVKGDEICPLLKELEVIKGHHIKTHTILIDDVRDFEYMGVTKFGVEKVLRDINPNYTIEYIDGNDGNNLCFPNDILVATI